MNISSSRPNIILAAGGTGGHLFPAMSVAKALEEKGFNPVFMIDARTKLKFEEKNTGWDFYVIKSGGIVGKNLYTRFKGAFLLSFGILQAAYLLWRLKPKAVIGFGGYPSLPPLLATRLIFLRKIKSIIHEGNAVAGTANRLLARLGAVLCLSFPNTKGFPKASQYQIVGMPVRPEMENLAKDFAYRPPAENGNINLLVLGGSLGASVFSTLMPQALSLLPENLRKRIHISQQAGDEFIPELENIYSTLQIHIRKLSPFFHDIIDQIKDAHLIIGRSGGGTVAEIIASRRPALFIPLPTASADEQTENAKYLSDANAGWLMSQKEISAHPEKLAHLLEDILRHPDRLANISKHLDDLAQPQAAQQFASFIAALLTNPSTASGHT